jgi:hypothetical protein
LDSAFGEHVKLELENGKTRAFVRTGVPASAGAVSLGFRIPTLPFTIAPQCRSA